jgi:integrase
MGRKFIEVEDKYVIGFLDLKEKENCSPATLTYYKCILKNYLDFISNNYQNANIDSLVRFMNNYNIRSRDIVGIVVKEFLQYLFDNKVISNEPKIKIKYTPGEIKSVEPEDLKKLIAEGSLLDKALLSFMVSSGLRRSEILSLKVKDLDFEKMRGRVKGKGQKEGERKQLFVFDETAKKYLLEYLRQRNAKLNEPLFLRDDGKQFTPFTFWFYFKKKFKFNPHRLRHSFCVFLAEREDISPAELQFLARHKRFETTQRYIQPDRERLVMQAQRKVKNILEKK